MCGEVLGCVIVATKDVEVVGVDLDVTTDRKVSWGNEFHSIIDVLIFESLKEWTFDDTTVLLGWLEDGDCIVTEVVGDNESSVDVFWNSCVESSGVSQDLLVVVDVLEEVNLWLLGNKVVDIAEGVDFISETVVRWNLNTNLLPGLWLFNIIDWEVSSMLLKVVVLGEFIDSTNIESSSVCYQWFVQKDLVAGKVSVSDE